MSKMIVLTGSLVPVITTVATSWTLSLPTATLLLVVILEHVFDGIKMLVAAVVPDIPEEVRMAQKEKLAARQHRSPAHPKPNDGGSEKDLGVETTHEQIKKNDVLLQHILKLSDLYRSWVASEHAQVMALQAQLDSQLSHIDH